ncbi:imidazolonepropionase [Stackebrandtia nassauensis DSM 44728]|uniref:Imidazolonepropionase n=1 Tax=Stackebrandtia nassauensis (strain DSM 44728 / CIP 108903 / NRRL B-16338 / NBRC 102104 / LLR-40K-21) TaxID=446470 RepID=D3Q0F6_STANL|nr:imidazolonepropionase [Stackebrandtia nassauensis]ADD39820.1 imidazolonepropionase [Stackebrandtia nassauensis DSM 44728]
MSLLVDNIGELSTCVGEPLSDAAVAIDGYEIAWVGPSGDAPSCDERVDAGGRAVIPGFVDSHSHLVFTGDRSAEFAARMAGRPYTAGGIRTTVAAVRGADDETLRANVRKHRAEMLRQGTTTVEIKSGYGLTVDDEARALRIASEFTSETTYLGGHIVPPEADADEYTALVAGDMLMSCLPYARWADVFCDRGAFDVEQAREILTAARDAGLGLRVHGNQLQHGPGVRLAVELGAASVDHCTFLSDADVEALADGDTVATLLPGVEFSTRSPFPDAKRLLDAGVTVALASDCNPGSCYSSSMPLMIAFAVRDMGMTVEQALWAATAGGARALRRDDLGVVAVGKRADLVILDAPSFVHLAYRPGVPLVHSVVHDGKIVDMALTRRLTFVRAASVARMGSKVWRYVSKPHQRPQVAAGKDSVDAVLDRVRLRSPRGVDSVGRRLRLHDQVRLDPGPGLRGPDRAVGRAAH